MWPLPVPLLALALAVAGCSSRPAAERSAASSSKAPPAPATPKHEAVATDPSFLELPGKIADPLLGFPQYPGANLVGSAVEAAAPPDPRSTQPPEGYRIKWTTPDGVLAVMRWYAKALPPEKWTYVAQDAKSQVESQGHITKGVLDGFISAEATAHGTEIILWLQDIRVANKKGQR
ncbi:MAG: hypothetical protein ABI672_12415 [Vicinamibacteria bacterium]